MHTKRWADIFNKLTYNIPGDLDYGCQLAYESPRLPHLRGKAARDCDFTLDKCLHDSTDEFILQARHLLGQFALILLRNILSAGQKSGKKARGQYVVQVCTDD